MKNLLFSIVLLLFFQPSYCDVVPPNSHYVQRCAKIINIDAFPDYGIFACIQSPTKKGIEAYLINSKDCIEKGYKFNALYIMATPRAYIEKFSKGSAQWLNDRNILESSISIPVGESYVDNDDPISSITEYYEIVEITNTNFELYKCKEIISYSDGRPVTLKNYPFPERHRKQKNNPEVVEIYPDIQVLSFLKALLLTLFIETCILFLFFKTKYKEATITNKLLLFTGIIASFATLPYVWFVFPAFIQSRIPYITVSECFAVLVESVIIYKLLKIEYKKALLVSMICNMVSFSIGLLINWITFTLPY
ncbi:hypothetical protein [Flavobacterium sp. 245]|uniref:hypothetical protein n=1 Tax=Flavobacterium sp. 245 TaxID=2512115 RepID=UPI00105B7133|nr:hypothetical protein [Flavobacterium sp. 245]